MNLRWVGEESRDRVAEVRALCYARAAKEIPDYISNMHMNRTTGPGDWLIAERDASPADDVGARGGAVSCQGVASVGTVKTSRKRIGNEPGVGTALMNEMIRAVRERNFVVSALMPFRGSYYDHFGYGIMERRTEWTVPLSIMPSGEFETVRLYDATRDREQLMHCGQRVAQRGQCDIE